MKKHSFQMSFERIFTRPDLDAWSMIHFRQPEAWESESAVTLERPDNWSEEAAALLADEAACHAVPPMLKAYEENTVPSWLWRHGPVTSSQIYRAAPANDETGTETSVRAIFDRFVGCAAYKGWQLGLFADEASALAFFEEARYALAQRFIAFAPKCLALPGRNWAYGAPTMAPPAPAADQLPSLPVLDVSNAMIDSIVGGQRDKDALAAWRKVTGMKGGPTPITFRFADIAADWGGDEGHQTHAMLAAFDLMAFRHNDGCVNTDALRHAARLAVTLIDLHGLADDALGIGFSNLSPLLMAMGLPYDSDQGRATAAAIAAVITAECFAASAELARVRGSGKNFSARRETVMRALRNHRRAAWGEKNDYEKISVLPEALDLDSCSDLSLAAAARAAWDNALDMARQHGLRHASATTLPASPELAVFMESATQGIAPMRALTILQPNGSGGFSRVVHPSVTEALLRLGSTPKEMRATLRHIAGTKSLALSPAIGHAALRAKGFDSATIQRLEDYLPQVENIRLAFTPWVLGTEFCRRALRIPADSMDDPRFDVLRHIGYSAKDIATANAWCYGHARLPNANPQSSLGAGVFVLADELTPDAQIRMASAVQSFVSGTTGLSLRLPAALRGERIEKLLLGAWRRGIRSASLAWDVDLKSTEANEAGTAKHRPLLKRKTRSKIAPSAYLHHGATPLPARSSKPGMRLQRSHRQKRIKQPVAGHLPSK